MESLEHPDFDVSLTSTSELYRPLGENEFRFLRLLPRGENGIIKCALVTATLDIDYHAISYVWGTQDDPETIGVNDCPLRVTKNLHELLLGCQTNPEVDGRLLWIDVICINQADLSERSSQVQMMGKIFASAVNVNTWFGPATEHTEELFGKLHDFSSEWNSSEARRRMGAIVDDEGLWSEWRSLIQHEWFQRLWVIQEAVLARNHQGWPGSHLIPVNSIIGSATTFLTGGVHRRYVEVRFVSDVQARISKFFRIDPQFETIKYVLFRFSRAQFGRCHDPRDHVYALLSLMPSACRPVVDYTLTTADVYTSMTLQLLGLSNGLEALRLVMPPKDDLSLPSWVLDFRHLAHATIGPTEQGDTDSCATARFSVTPNLMSGELRARGIEVTTIVTTVRHFYTAYTDGLPSWANDTQNDQQRQFRMHLQTWRAVAIKHAKLELRAPASFEIGFWATIVMGKLPIDSPESSSTARIGKKYVDSDMVRSLDQWLYAKEDEPNAMLNPKLYGALLRGALLSTPFVTADGRMGSCPQFSEAKEGDTIAILAGLSWPIVLRKSSDTKKWRVVRVCYCTGLMDGVFVRDLAEQKTGNRERVDDVFEEMVLV